METIRARITDEMAKKLEILVEDVKREAPRGAEVTMSSIVRGGLEKFIEEKEFEKNNIILLPISLSDVPDETLLKLHHLSVRLTIDKFKTFDDYSSNGQYEMYRKISDDLDKCYKLILSEAKKRELNSEKEQSK